MELARVKKIFGYALKPILGMPNGYYVLDLAKEKDRLCMSLLLEQSEFQMSRCIEQSVDGLVRTARGACLRCLTDACRVSVVT